MDAYRPDWLGAIGAGIAALISFAIAKGVTNRTRNPTVFYAVLAAGTFVLSLAIRELLRFFGI